MNSYLSQADAVACPVCTSKSQEAVYAFQGVWNELRVSMCCECGFLFSNPRLSQQKLLNWYQAHGLPTRLQTSARVSKEARWVKVFWEEMIKAKLENPFKILSVGLSPFSLQAALECDPGFCEIEELHPVQIDNFFHEKSASLAYDVIILHHALEQWVEPQEVLARLKKYLKVSGCFLINIYNFYAENRFAKMAEPPDLRSLKNGDFQINYFQIKTASRLFAQSGLRTNREHFIGKSRAMNGQGEHSTMMYRCSVMPETECQTIRNLSERAFVSQKRLVEFKLRYVNLRRSWKERFLRSHFFRKSRFYWVRFRHHGFLKKLLYGKKILILGTAPSAQELQTLSIPKNVLVMTCNAGLSLWTQVSSSREIAVYICSGNKLQKNLTEEHLYKTPIRTIISGFVEWNERKNALRLPRPRIIPYDGPWGDFYVRKLLSPYAFQHRKTISAGLRLLLYALYFGAAEVYLLGIDLSHQGYFWGGENKQKHLAVDLDFLKICSQKYKNIYSVSSTSPVTQIIPHKVF